MLQSLDTNTISQICANISIPSLPDIIKELVDNSIDSSATNIRLEIVEGGVEQIIICDNGTGIKEECFDTLCHRGTTSKLSQFEDVFKLSSFGFRGQALSAIATLCDVTLITKVKESNTTFIVSFDNNGNVCGKNTINDKNKCSYTMPLNLQSILCILIAYEYKFSVTTITALFQLYANDLIVIALTLLSSKNLENSFIEDSKQILEKLKTKQGNLSTRAESLFNLLKYTIFENKIYLPSDLW